MRHIIQAKKINPGDWILFNMVTDKPIGEERADRYATRKEAYDACMRMWRSNSVWQGKRVHGGYSIEVV